MITGIRKEVIPATKLHMATEEPVQDIDGYVENMEAIE